jgi:hypothetical protein
VKFAARAEGECGNHMSGQKPFRKVAHDIFCNECTKILIRFIYIAAREGYDS